MLLPVMASKAKEKLIESAITVFAKHGYREGKVADIVKGADANIAAVNYHFGSKDQLFVQALRHAFVVANAAYPAKGHLPASASAEDKIAALARAILRRSFDDGPAGDFNRIMSATFHAPGSPIELILNEVLAEEVIYKRALLAEFLQTNSETLLSLAAADLIGLATVFSVRPTGRDDFFESPPSQDEIDRLIECQIKVILAALKALASAYEPSNELV